MSEVNSPFTPGSPVPLELFVGRSEQIAQVMRHVRQAVSGKQENVFLTGDRGIGKSSFASFLRHLATRDHNMLGAHVFLGRVSTLEEMVRHTLEEILKETREQPWFDQLSAYFGDHVRQLGMFGVTVTFDPPERDLTELVRKFPEVLGNVVAQIADEKAGLFIILDDMNGLAESIEFANWYKSLIDEIATQYPQFPVLIMLIGLPEKRDSLASLQPSLLRVFRVCEIERLSSDEVREFFANAFAGVDREVHDDAFEVLVRYSSGIPFLMHEIGDATFWLDEDDVIDKKDAFNGVIEAAENVGTKYLDPNVYRAIRSPRYRSIIRKIVVERPGGRSFSRSEVKSRLDPDETRVFDNLLRKLRQMDIVERDLEGGAGAYLFANQMYPIYLWMESLQAGVARSLDD